MFILTTVRGNTTAPSGRIITIDLADKNRVAADNLYILPANANPLALAAYTPKFGSPENNQSNYPPAAGINLNIAYKPQAAAVGFVDNLLTAQFCYATIHFTPPNSSHHIICRKNQKQTVQRQNSLLRSVLLSKFLSGKSVLRLYKITLAG